MNGVALYVKIGHKSVRITDCTLDGDGGVFVNRQRIATLDDKAQELISAFQSSTVPLEPFQRRFAEMEPGAPLTPGGRFKDAAVLVALRLGWFNHKGKPDGSRVRRTLGLRPAATTYPDRLHYYPPKYRQWVHRPMAKRLCDAMDMDYAEVDL